jgi:hypothetical protein
VTFDGVGDKTRVMIDQTSEDAGVFGKIEDVAIVGNEGNLDCLTELFGGRR